MDDWKLLTTKEVASILGKHVQTVQKWRREGIIPKPIVDCRNPAWSWCQIRRWMELDETGRVEPDSD